MIELERILSWKDADDDGDGDDDGGNRLIRLYAI
jgi:hypothetical protein